ncbi:MAG: helix-hairpin-helix domain-containing protein [Thermomicrobiales bacterium]|nr:helix-hairpin-helix domain-containing protein [Thermomicrobiales bacterium]
MTCLPPIPKSAVAVLNIAGVQTLEDCATWSAAELAQLRGFGPKAFATVAQAMTEVGLVFDESSEKRADPINVAMAAERMKDAPVIPDTPTDLPFIGGPARSALAAAGIHDLAGVARHSRKELLALHGFGPKAIRLLEPALAEKGLRFRDET